MFDFCGIGNACIDIVARVDDAFLASWKFPKGICTHLTLEQANALEAALNDPAYIPGGCAANTAAGIMALGGKAVFIGKTAQDAIGAKFRDNMNELGIRFANPPDTSGAFGSTRIFCLTTPDAERTFASYYGIQDNMNPDDLDEQGITTSRFLYLDGYALNSKRGGETFLAAAHMAKKAGQSVTFAPCDLSILNLHADAVTAISKTADLLLCNEQEAQFMAQEKSLDTAIEKLRQTYPKGAVTIGAEGVIAFDENGLYRVAAETPPGPVVDTNGAGDAFAGGFLFALSRGYPMTKAAKLGNMCAAEIITHYGARPKADYRHFSEKL